MNSVGKYLIGISLLISYLSLIISDSYGQAHAIKIMSYNVRSPGWVDHSQNVIGVIKDEAPDLIGLQEASDNGRPFGIATEINVGLGQNYVFLTGGKSSIGTRIAYNSNKLNVLESGIHLMPACEGSTFMRSISWARLKVTSNGNQFMFYTTHFCTVSHLSSQEENARMLIELLEDHSNDFKKSGLPVVVAGDFNSDENSDIMQFIYSTTIDGFSLIDTWVNGKRPNTSANKSIDFILTGDKQGVTIYNSWINDTPGASDHFPIMILASINSETSARSIDKLEVKDRLKNEVKIYPNPANQKINLVLDSDWNQSSTFEIFSINGVKIDQDTYAVSSSNKLLTKEIDITNLEKGVYVLRVESNGKIFSRQLIKE